ncbi:alveolar macrophage chemotactic factor-like [Paroedura picta]|uniref:alveolar macrophage chemotactic factor-like n=1 Tax=Paroedura picta TaxID=143630 RepID=UPI004056EEFF
MLLQPSPDQAEMSLCCRVAPILLFSLLAGTLLQSRAAPLTRCQCDKLFSGRIPTKLIAWLSIYAVGPHCANTEVIASTTDGSEVCLDPGAAWVRVAIKRILENVEES